MDATPPSSEPSPVVAKLSDLLSQRPTNFEITILPIAPDDNGPDPETDAALAPTKKKGKKAKKELSLDQSLLLIDGQYLGLDARSLPWMTQEIRAEYRKLRPRAQTRSPDADDSCADLLAVTSCLLLVNPDHATAWADRRRSLLRQTQMLDGRTGCPGQDPSDPSKSNGGAQGLWAGELEFLNLLMTQHSKAPSSWGHRKYVLKKLLQSIANSSSTEGNGSEERVIRGEIALCRSVAEKFPKNYYAWTHRRYLWSMGWNSANPAVSMLSDEWMEMVDRWLPLHISDHSGAHYAAQVLALWMKGVSASQATDNNAKGVATALEQIAAQALEHAKELVDRHSEHETLWILRRMVVRILWDYGARINRIAALAEEHVLQVAATITSKLESTASMGSTSPETYENSTALVHGLSFLAWIDQTCSNDELDISRCRSPDRTILQDSIRFQVFETLKDHPCVHHRLWTYSPWEVTR